MNGDFLIPKQKLITSILKILVLFHFARVSEMRQKNKEKVLSSDYEIERASKKHYKFISNVSTQKPLKSKKKLIIQFLNFIKQMDWI